MIEGTIKAQSVASIIHRRPRAHLFFVLATLTAVFEQSVTRTARAKLLKEQGVSEAFDTAGIDNSVTKRILKSNALFFTGSKRLSFGNSWSRVHYAEVKAKVRLFKFASLSIVSGLPTHHLLLVESELNSAALNS